MRTVERLAYTPTEAAEVASVSRPTLYRWMRLIKAIGISRHAEHGRKQIWPRKKNYRRRKSCRQYYTA